MTPTNHVILSAAKNLCISLLLLLLLFAPAPLQSQGCAQCRDSLAQTPIRTQLAYRKAITLMVLAGSTVFAGAFIALRRYRS